MEVAMVKHSENSKIYWFGVPKQLEGELHSGDRVVCDTAKGAQSGVIISAGMRDQDVADVMKASGATYPLRMIVDVTKDIPLKKIVIPEEFKRTLPRDWKLPYECAGGRKGRPARRLYRLPGGKDASLAVFDSVRGQRKESGGILI